MAQTARYRRKRYLVATKFQLKYIGLILIIVVLTGTICSYVVYYTTMLLLGDKLANVYPQGRLISIVNTVNLRILLSLILVAPLMVIIGVFASHKIAGPIYRIEKFLENMANGDYSSMLTLRKNDELIPLANGINRFIETIKGTIKEERSELEQVFVSLDSLRRVVDAEPVDRSVLIDAVDKLSEELIKVNKELEKYKI